MGGGMSAQYLCCTMCDTSTAVKDCLNACRYLIMISLHHLPTRLMILVSTLVRSSSIDPPAYIYRVLISSFLNPTCGPEILTAARRDLVILCCTQRIIFHFDGPLQVALGGCFHVVEGLQHHTWCLTRHMFLGALFPRAQWIILWRNISALWTEEWKNWQPRRCGVWKLWLDSGHFRHRVECLGVVRRWRQSWCAICHQVV